MAEIKVYPRFVPKDRNLFFATLQKRVNQYFKDNQISRYANTSMVVKTIVLLSSFIIPIVLLNTMVLNNIIVVLLYALLGVSMAGIGMGVMHDAVHGSYSSNKNVNKWLGYSLNLIGGMVYNWKFQHNVLHHTYTNVHEADDDIANKLILRFSPHAQAKRIHRFQFIYVFFFYSILTLYWMLAKDFVQHFRYMKNGVNRYEKLVNIRLFLSTILLKLMFVSYLIIGPIVFQHYSVGLIIGGFLLMQAVAGLLLGLTFQLAHSVEEASFPLPNSDNVIENDWAIHQMNTTVNFARNNKLLSWYVGGLNYQVEHHLFPHICHVHYPEISKIVEQTAAEYNVPYLCAPDLKAAFGSHMRMLKKFGYEINLDLATM